MPQYILVEGRIKQMRERLKEMEIRKEALEAFDKFVSNSRKSARSFSQFITEVVMWLRLARQSPEFFGRQ